MNTATISALRRYLVGVAVDFGLVFICFYAAFLLRFEAVIPSDHLQAFFRFIPFVGTIYCLGNYLFRLYSRIWAYASSQEAISILSSVIVSTGIIGLLDLGTPIPRMFPLSVVLMGSVLTLAAFVAVRYRSRLITGFLWRWRRIANDNRSRVLIIGGGDAGQLLAWSLRNQGDDYEVIGFIDDDASKKGMRIHEITVLGDREQIVSIASRRVVDIIAIALDKATAEDFHDILTRCQSTAAKVKVVPSLAEAITGVNGKTPLRDMTVEDLLGRRAITIDVEACLKLISGKVVLVTGAAGSIGSELCRQVLRFEPRLLVMLDNNESGLFDLALDLALWSKNPPMKSVVGSILQENKMESLFGEYQPQIVFHCAAYKHVPIMEENPEEAIWVNLQGARNVATLALKHGVERFVFISSDKAVEPISVMGVTKRLGELLICSTPAQGDAKFTCVRFGNVLNSRGSVIPIFLKEIEHGGPVTITSPDMKRFFMGLLEAVSLIIQAATLTRGGDIFVLEMGEEISIEELAKRVIRLQGLRVGDDIQLVYSGIRPGEKLREKLFYGSIEEKELTSHPYIFRVSSNHTVHWEVINAGIDELVELTKNGNKETMKKKLYTLAELPHKAGRAE